MTRRWQGHRGVSLLIGSITGLLLTAQAQQPPAAIPDTQADPYTVGRIFSHGIPNGYHLQQAGELPANEGGGSFLVLTEPTQQITAVLVDIDDLGWLKTTRLKSANPVTVAQHLLSQYFPNKAKTKVTENKKATTQNQLASHLVFTNASHPPEPAITLRLLYPQNRAVILLLWQPGEIFPIGTQDFSSAYQTQESQAQQLINDIRVSGKPLPTERYMLWRLRTIFKNGVFSHTVEP